jgi:3,4-dihydroxy 2-butanone 4-phosphate synthase/GTP cyclohydrolase II
VPAGVICEIMNDDGTMARLPDLIPFARHHGIKLGTIADLIAYRRRTEKLVRRVEEGMVPVLDTGLWRVIAYQNLVDDVEHLALVRGDVSGPEPVLVRMHAIDTIGDILGGPHLGRLHGAIAEIDAAGRGIVVLIRESYSNAASERIRALSRGDRREPPLRDYGIGAQILADLGIGDMMLLSSRKRTIIGLDGYGLNVVDQRIIA